MFSEPVRQLIARHIVSIEQLEILLLLREHHGRSWSPAQVNDRIQSSLASVTARLQDLVARGLLQQEGAGAEFRYDPSRDHEAAVAALARDYRERRYSVIDLIFSKGSDRLKVFADAFKVKKGDPNG